MERSLIYAFWACGDEGIIEYALQRSRINRRERDVLTAVLDDCLTQEAAAEKLNISTRTLQKIWRDAAEKVLKLPWVYAYALTLKK